MNDTLGKSQTADMTGSVDGVPFTSPIEKKIASFVPTKDFDSEEMDMTFYKGVSYWLREGNLKMASNLLKWPVDIEVLDKTLFEGMTHGDCP